MKCYYCHEPVKTALEHRHIMHRTQEGDTYHVCASIDCDWIYYTTQNEVKTLPETDLYYCFLCREDRVIIKK